MVGPATRQLALPPTSGKSEHVLSVTNVQITTGAIKQLTDDAKKVLFLPNVKLGKILTVQIKYFFWLDFMFILVSQTIPNSDILL